MHRRANVLSVKAKFHYPLTSLIPFALEDWARALDIDRNKLMGPVGWPFVLLSMGATYALLRHRLSEVEHRPLLGASLLSQT